MLVATNPEPRACVLGSWCELPTCLLAKPKEGPEITVLKSDSLNLLLGPPTECSQPSPCLADPVTWGWGEVGTETHQWNTVSGKKEPLCHWRCHTSTILYDGGGKKGHVWLSSRPPALLRPQGSALTAFGDFLPSHRFRFAHTDDSDQVGPIPSMQDWFKI